MIILTNKQICNYLVGKEVELVMGQEQVDFDVHNNHIFHYNHIQHNHFDHNRIDHNYNYHNCNHLIVTYTMMPKKKEIIKG